MDVTHVRPCTELHPRFRPVPRATSVMLAAVRSGVHIPLFDIEPTTDLLKKAGSSGNEGLNLFIEGGRVNGEMYQGTSEVRQLPGHLLVVL